MIPLTMHQLLMKPMKLLAGALVGKHHPIHVEDVRPALEVKGNQETLDQKRSCSRTCSGPVPINLWKLWE